MVISDQNFDISSKANIVLKILYLNDIQGIFKTMIILSLGHLFCTIIFCKGDELTNLKPIIIVKMPRKLLHIVQVKEF